MAQKITRWLLFSLILTLGFGQLLRFNWYGVPLYLHDILVLAILVLHGRSLKVVQVPLGLKIFLAGLALGWLSALLHYPLTQLLVPSLYTLRLLSYLTLYFSLRTQHVKLPQRIFLLSGLTTLIIGLLQYFYLPDMRVFQYLGWDDHLNRLTLPHFDPTFTASMLSLAVLSTPFTLYLAPFILGILLTYSRSVWLSLVLTAFITLKSKKILLISGTLLLLYVFALPQKFGEGTNLLRSYSISSRLQADLSSVRQYQWGMLIGRGLNTLPLNDAGSRYPDHATGPNNSYLYLLLTTGILGLVGWGVFCKNLYLGSTHKPMLIFFFLASLFNNVMFYPFALLWVLLIESQSSFDL